jgi:predicted nucleic acid-binding protein
MTLVDAGPLVSLLDRDDTFHAACFAAAARLAPGELLTTWPCFTEDMYLLRGVGGYRYQALLWQMLDAGRLELCELTVDEISRAAALMSQYHDTPMDLADATLVSIAESRGFRQIFTLDSDFRFYRLADGSVLDVIP